VTGSGGLSSVEYYVGVEEVLRQILGKIQVGSTSQVVTTSEAYGRVAASDILAREDVPKTAISHMDGYAVRADDLRNASEAHSVKLTVRGDFRPGEKPMASLQHGQAARVATGASLPAGADTVIPLEGLREIKGGIVVGASPDPGGFVYPRGEDVEEGDMIIEHGGAIRSQDVGFLLALGEEKVKVVRKPRVAVLATGNELTGGRPKAGKVRNSHSPIFLRLLEAMGCVPVDLGISKDLPRLISRKISAGLSKCDFVITLGGTSVGRRDAVGRAVSLLDPEVVFHGIKMDRGRVTGMALVKGKPVLMMPGPIQGAMSAFILLAVPTVGLLARRSRSLLILDCVLGSNWEARKRFSGFTKVVYISLKGGWEVAEPIHGDTESISILSKADGYVVVPENVTSIPKGSRVEVNLLQGFSFA
jgi:molybdenum cofactor synthesis domain-containing protein